MKQLLILMVFLLAVMLLISGVMAMGNAKQSVQIADRVQQLSNLKAELRGVQKENRALSGELESVQTSNRKLRWEQQVIAAQLAGILPFSESGLLPIPSAAVSQPTGAVLLEAMAIKQAVEAARQEETPTVPAARKADNTSDRIRWVAAETGEEKNGMAAGSKADGITGENDRAEGETITPGADCMPAYPVTGGGGETVSKPAQQTMPCPRETECRCCQKGSQSGRGTILAVSEAVTVPVASGGSDTARAAANLLMLIQQQTEKIGDLLRDLLGLAHTLGINLSALPTAPGA